MAVLNACLAAKDIGVDSCIRTTQPAKASRLLKTKSEDQVRLLVGLGHEKRGAYQKNRERNQLLDIAFDEVFGNQSKLWSKK